MEKNILEVMFNMYQDEARTIFFDKGEDTLLNTLYVNCLQTRNVLLWVQDKLLVDSASTKKVVKHLKRIASTSLRNYVSATDIMFFENIYKEKKRIQKSINMYEDLVEISICDFNRIASAEDFSMLPYQYAVVKLLNDGIINQDNYNDELFRKIKCYQKDEEYKPIYSDKSYEFLTFITDKVSNIIIDDGYDSYNKSKKRIKFSI